MAKQLLGNALLSFSIALLLHAAFSTYEHLSHLKALGRPEDSLPFDIILETLLSLAFGIFSASIRAPETREITWASEMKKWSIDDMDSRLGFANFVTRGTVLGASSTHS